MIKFKNELLIYKYNGNIFQGALDIWNYLSGAEIMVKGICQIETEK